MNGSLDGSTFPGKRLRHYRRKAKLSLKQLAVSAGCSESLLSKIENGHANPSLSMIHRIANALNLSVTSLFEDVHRSGRVVLHESERPRMRLESSDSRNIILERLVPEDAEHLLQANIHIVEVGGDSRGTITHEGEELGFMLEGSLELTVDGTIYHLTRGDCFLFRSELPHSYRNVGDTDARVLWVNTPATF